ncbi:hypothetical protein ACIQGZ_16920 [Streptomyces sp. NPDC092296]|uniref:hypothetical protein n=1 Tax=Streptomyces sp. NPDC092296 TaxID=3366012 RepID=UPI003801BDBA
MPILCMAVDCGNRATFQWQRRPTDAELVPIIAMAEAWRAEMIATNPENPPRLPPLPDATNITVPVYACAEHEIDMDLACHTHQATCTAPNPANLPGCDCDPEPLPPPDPQD